MSHRAEAAVLPDPPGAAGPSLSIYFVDVGQGAATLVLGPPDGGRRSALLIDAGNIRPAADRAPGTEPIDSGSLLHTMLEGLGVREIDYVVLTHFDADHLGGFVTTSNSYSLLWSADCARRPTFPRRAIVDLGPSKSTTASVREWQRCLSNEPNRVAIEGPSDLGYRMDLGLGHVARVVAGQGWALGQSEPVPHVNTENERSIALLVSAPSGFDLLVTGDLIGRSAGDENARVEAALGRALAAEEVSVEVLDVGHHGAANASEPGFIDSIRPEVAIISTGKNGYGHPSCEAYESLTPPEVQVVLQTELGNSLCEDHAAVTPIVANGTIRVEVSEGRYTVSSFGTVSPLNGFPTRQFSFTCAIGGDCEGASAMGSPPRR